MGDTDLHEARSSYVMAIKQEIEENERELQDQSDAFEVTRKNLKTKIKILRKELAQFGE